jgi:hypothetical protein
MQQRTMIIAGAGAVLLAAFVVWKLSERKNGEGIVRSVAQTVAETAAGVANDAATGVVTGIGSAFGLPLTDEAACERAIAEGRMWDASFVCPAPRFLKAVFQGK